jgi:putative FmdB family regulatory protein
MATYEYICKKCGHGFETFQRITYDPVDSYPRRGGKTERLIGLGGGFILP